MSTTVDQSGDPKADHLRRYLRERIKEGETYFKSRYIAQDLEFTPHQVGALLSKLSNRNTELDIEQWSESNGTTWRITLG
jgi:hypothetical protein